MKPEINKNFDETYLSIREVLEKIIFIKNETGN